MNYLFLGGILKFKYMFVDINTTGDYLIDSLCNKRKLKVKFGKEAAVTFKDEPEYNKDKYRLVLCKIKKKDQKQFEEALDELKTKMLIFGYTDYEDYCDCLARHLR